jgi:hypothetical protein
MLPAYPLPLLTACAGQDSPPAEQQGGDNLLMNMELGGASAWGNGSSGGGGGGRGPPAPGQTDEAEGRPASASGLNRLGSLEDQQLAGPQFTT